MANPNNDPPQPIVHPLFDATTRIWQYVVAYPFTNHAVIIDAILLPDSSALISTQPADDILALVRQKSYKIEWILETSELSPRSNYRSAAYYLRMQLLEKQKFAPRICSPNGAVSNFKSFFARKYASMLSTNFDDTQPRHGENIPVGQMYVTPLSLPGLGSRHAKGYLIGTNVFGAYTLLHIQQAMQDPSFAENFDIASMSETHCNELWTSVQRVLGMPFDFRIWFDRGQGFGKAGGGRAVRFEGEEKSEVKGDEDFATVVECRNQNKDMRSVGEEFMGRWADARDRRERENDGMVGVASSRKKGWRQAR